MRNHVEAIAVDIKTGNVIGHVSDLVPWDVRIPNLVESREIKGYLILDSMSHHPKDVLGARRRGNEGEVAFRHGHSRRESVAENRSISFGICAQMVKVIAAI